MNCCLSTISRATLPAQSSIALEATSLYHLDAAELAHGMGHRVYVVDAYRVSHYRESIGQRAKTDPCDARLLARYLSSEQQRLRIWNPPPPLYTVLKSLLNKRAQLIKAHVALMLSWSSEPLLKALSAQQLEHFKQSDQAIQKLLRKASQEAGISENIRRCKAIEGIGELTATCWLRPTRFRRPCCPCCVNRKVRNKKAPPVGAFFCANEIPAVVRVINVFCKVREKVELTFVAG
ncbi:transposase [Kosakonia sp. H02]|nr:transposase [Kosakonia sp. H02]